MLNIIFIEVGQVPSSDRWFDVSKGCEACHYQLSRRPYMPVAVAWNAAEGLVTRLTIESPAGHSVTIQFVCLLWPQHLSKPQAA